MKQLIQNLKNGDTTLEEIPTPTLKKGFVLIQTTYSLVSLGTERMLVDFGKANYVEKAFQQPEKVKQVISKVKTEGLIPTVDAVLNKLDQPIPLGYCNVGRVVGVGKGVSQFNIGDRVASNGSHAEFVSVPENLVAKIPDNVTDEEATFTVIGSIGLQGIRLLNPTFGETIVVSGLGLIGQITAQLLISNGCRVIGFDFDEKKVELAAEKGIEAYKISNGLDVVQTVNELTNGIGADGVIITASAKSNEIISQAAQMSRKRGSIILVGVIGLDINRSDFYEKELKFQVSCSYGPGRYDDNYEQKGHDYPLAFVRWTEKRNFESILFAISTGKLDVESLITEIIEFENFEEIYSDMKKTGSVASILKYNTEGKTNQSVILIDKNYSSSKAVLGIIGAGNYTKMTVLPILKKLNADIKFISSANGLNATSMAKKYSIAVSTTNNDEIFNDEDVDTVLITTRHNQHAPLILNALASKKNVFVEKPMALNTEELSEIERAYLISENSISVGYNRRFSPHSIKMKELLGNSLMNIVATMNAGFIPKNSWVHDLQEGGGRIIGEACHFLDLCIYLTSSKIKSVCANFLGNNPEENSDNASILLKFENGSSAVINYFSNGNKNYSKERVEVFSQEKILILDNFRTLQGYGFKGFSKMKTNLDKGHKNQFQTLINNIKTSGEPIIPFDQLVNSSKASFAIIESLKSKSWIEI